MDTCVSRIDENHNSFAKEGIQNHGFLSSLTTTYCEGINLVENCQLFKILCCYYKLF